MRKRLAQQVRFVVVAVLLLATGVFLQARRRAEKVPSCLPLASFPLHVGSWAGQELAISASIRQVLGSGDFLSRFYFHSRNQPYIDFFIAYFPSQRAGDTIHSPKNCLPGSGWTPVDSAHIELTAPGRAPVTVNRYVIAKGLDRDLVLYWYQAHGRTVASEYWAKFYLVADAMRMNRTDGSLVRVITPIAGDESLQSAQDRAIDFAQQIIPQLDSYIPR